MRESAARRIRVEVIINGQSNSMLAIMDEPLQELISKALRRTGHSVSIAEWELRDADGYLKESTVTPKAYGLVAGQRLYLSPRAGIGA